ncbi:MAG: FAD-dependent oxidoreductase [Planctomycetota bacterium]
MTSAIEYDVLVLGGGSAGTRAAQTAAERGARTAMFNDGELGGLCILRGCMPTKTMLHAAHLVHEARHHHTRGVGRAAVSVDFAEVMANKDEKVARFKRAKVAGIENGGYDVIDARARFSGPDTVEAGGQTYRFKSGAVLATGSVASHLEIPGIDEVPQFTSDDAMRLEEQPPSVIVVGTGAIGLELAQFFARLGTPTTLVSRRPLLARIDPLLSEEAHKAVDAEPNLELLCPYRPVRALRDGDEVVLELDGPEVGRSVRAAVLLQAIGREPALDGLGLETAGIAVDANGPVAGDDLRTTNPRVFVAGDARGKRLLLHVANWEGRVAGLNAAEPGATHALDERLDVDVIFIDPPMASVGLTEAAAKERDLPVITASARFAETGRAITQDVTHGAWKIVAAPSGEILGSQILGPRADDLIHTVAAVMYYRGTAADLLEMPWYHPTVSEVLLGLARDLQKQVESVR